MKISAESRMPVSPWALLVKLFAFLPEVFKLASHSLSHLWWLLPHSSDNQTLITENMNNWSVEEVIMWPKLQNHNFSL